jgi:hypothetical protein
MRGRCTSIGVLGIALAACGGKTGSEPPPPAPTCASTTLTASAPTLVASGQGAFPSLAATPEGDRFLIVTENGVGGSVGTFVHVTSSGALASPAFQVSIEGRAVAAFDGTAFDVIAAPPSTKPSPMTLQRFNVEGTPLGPAVDIPIHAMQLMPAPGAPPPVVASPSGLALMLSEPGIKAAVDLHAVLIGVDGTVLRDDSLMSGTVDPYYGDGPYGSLALVGGRMIAQFTSPWMPGFPISVADLGWFGTAASTTVVGTQTGQCDVQLIGIGQKLAFSQCTGSDQWLFEGPPGGPFAKEWQLDGSLIASDGCGRVVNVGVSGQGPETLLARPWNGSPASISIDAYPDQLITTRDIAIAPTRSGFGVAWVDSDGVHFSTLAWQ